MSQLSLYEMQFSFCVIMRAWARKRLTIVTLCDIWWLCCFSFDSDNLLLSLTHNSNSPNIRHLFDNIFNLHPQSSISFKKFLFCSYSAYCFYTALEKVRNLCKTEHSGMILKQNSVTLVLWKHVLLLPDTLLFPLLKAESTRYIASLHGTC